MLKKQNKKTAHICRRTTSPQNKTLETTLETKQTVESNVAESRPVLQNEKNSSVQGSISFIS